MPRIRTFVAIAIDSALLDATAQLQRSLEADGVIAKWVEPESMHLTLAFLGDVDDKEIPTVCQAARETASRFAPFSLLLGGVGAFPNLRRPKIAWAGIRDGAEPLIALHDALAERLEAAFLYRREDRGYSPHLTLGRVKAEGDSQTLATALTKQAEWKGGRMTVERVLVYSSEMRRGGPEYAVLGRAELSGTR